MWTAAAFLVATATIANTTWPELGPLQNARLGADDVVLVAGVGRPFVLPAIPGATEVATEWYRFFVEGRGVPVERAVLLRDADVTKETVLAEAKRLRAMRKGKGTFFVVFIGHGAPSVTGADGLLLGVDVQPTIRSITDRGLSQQALLEAAGGDVVAIFDACFTGVRSDGSGEPLVPGAQATLPVRRTTPTKNVTVLQASEAVAGPLPGHNKPAFSYLLLGGLRGWADNDGDGTVRISDAFAYAKKTLTVAVMSRNQVPTMYGGGELVGYRGAKEKGPSLQRAVEHTQLVTLPAERMPPTTRDTFDRNAAEDAFKKRQLVVASNGFVRGPYAQPVGNDSVAAEGKQVAPDAVAVMEELTDKSLVAAVAGGGVGVITALTCAAGYFFLNKAEAFGTSSFSSSDPGSTIALSLTVGGSMGLSAGMLAWWAFAPDENDEARLSKARADVASAINTEERRKLGLDP